MTTRIIDRSRKTREAYLARLATMLSTPHGKASMGCANVAHAVAALPERAKQQLMRGEGPNIGIVTAFNEVLSAHAPYESYPREIAKEARKHGANAQVAGGTPAMCDGVTQGRPGMQLSLFSRDVIAQSVAVALTHDIFDCAIHLGICDKIVPGLLIGALHFGYLPQIFIPSGPMPSGLSNSEKSRVREDHAKGLIGRDELMKAESKAYHACGTCTFFGTANSNQMLLEAMGLHLPNAAFHHPGTPLRQALTKAAVRELLAITRDRATPLGRLVDERCIVNAFVALLATGGSTNHTIHWLAVARAAGIIVDWQDISDLSDEVPLLASVYPSGTADVNQFQSAGGPAFVIKQLLEGGYMHPDVLTVSAGGLEAYTKIPTLVNGRLKWVDVKQGDSSIVRTFNEPFRPTGGLRLLSGNVGRSFIKTSSVPEDRLIIKAPARVFYTQADLESAFKAGELNCDHIAVLPYQGPKSNGMPELHKLTPIMSVLQRSHRVAILTDGRMSGASGKVPAAIHCCPEAADNGPIARIKDGDMIELDAIRGVLNVIVPEDEWNARLVEKPELDEAHSYGRELFAAMRRNVLPADQGAVTWL